MILLREQRPVPDRVGEEEEGGAVEVLEVGAGLGDADGAVGEEAVAVGVGPESNVVCGS